MLVSRFTVFESTPATPAAGAAAATGAAVGAAPPPAAGAGRGATLIVGASVGRFNLIVFGDPGSALSPSSAEARTFSSETREVCLLAF